MNNELERFWRETAVALSRYYLGICLERLENHENCQSGY
jgi:hypothetical protein